MGENKIDYKEKLDEYMYSISHDLQEPVRMIRSYSTLIKSKYWDSTPDNVKELLIYVLDGSDRLQLMMDALLEISRIQNNEHKYSHLELDTIISKCQRNLSEMIEVNNVIFDVNDLGKVYSNRSLLIKMLTEIFKNSIIFNNNDPVIKVIRKQEHDFDIIAIEDNSISIEDNFVEKALKLFTKLSARDEYPGVGAGLYVCNIICEAHNGSIKFKQSENGQIVEIYLPIISENS